MTDPVRFSRAYPFPLDQFQRTAIEALHGGESVLVAAPTGSGKTVVAEFAVERALSHRRKAFYTTPLKALSNQKYGDFMSRYGAGRVGLLTGDNSINSEAPVVVMTTEVLRNMLYEGSLTLEGLETVVMDEVHYLQDPYRGAVWEEVLIHLPLSVSVVCLSATVSNAEEFGEWIGALRGPTRVVIEERRPVPLENLYLVGRELHPMHVEHQGHLNPNPYLVSLDKRQLRVTHRQRRSSGTWVTSSQGRPLGAGVAAHHAGMLPVFKEIVEDLFAAGLVKVVFATETLSLGINMPAKTVVIEDLWKFSGERHELLTPGEYTQLTGRAGRRGIDPIGYAVVLYQQQVPFERVAGLASTRTYELRSSFRPSYNMTVNLVRNYTRQQARHLLNSSFAQFLADRGVVTLERELERDGAAIAGYREAMDCHLGDFAEYWALRERARRIREDARRLTERERDAAARAALSRLRPGDVIYVPSARRRGLAVVLTSREG